MYGIVASAGHARKGIALQIVHHRYVRRALKRSRAFVAVQTFPVVVWMIQMNRIHRRFEILHIDVVQAVQLYAKAAIHRVVGVTGVAGFVGGNAVILKMCAGNIILVVYIQTLAPRRHDVAGKTETGLLGALKMFGSAKSAAKNRQNAEPDEGEHLSFAGYGQGRTKHHHRDYDDGHANQQK